MKPIYEPKGKGVYNTECVLDDIDNLLKEMVGEDE